MKMTYDEFFADAGHLVIDVTPRSPEEQRLATMDKLGAEVVQTNHGSEQDTNTEWSK